MKFRVTFLDGVDLLIEAEKEVDAVRKVKELKDKLSVVNTDYFSGEDLSKYSESFLRRRLEELEKVQPIPKNLYAEWNGILKELENRGVVKFKDSVQINDGYYWNDLRRLCIKNDYYTNGSNEEYNNLFDMARTGKWNAEKIAEDIFMHSDEKADYNTILSQVKKLNPKAVVDSSIYKNDAVSKMTLSLVKGWLETSKIAATKGDVETVRRHIQLIEDELREYYTERGLIESAINTLEDYLRLARSELTYAIRNKK